MPGHEIIGSAVTKSKTGDVMGVGCMVDSGGTRSSCREDEGNHCEVPVGWSATYTGYLKPRNKDFNTFGGYSTDIMVKESFVLRITDALDITAAAPMLYAGSTTYPPMKHLKVGSGQSVAAVGIGGLGYLAVQIAQALSATATAVTRIKEK